MRIDALTIVSWKTPDLTLDIECGKGTYIRSLAFDLGRRLGPGAYLAGLIRTRSGPFTLDQSVTLEELEVALAGDSWRALLHPADEALADWGVVTTGRGGRATATQRADAFPAIGIHHRRNSRERVAARLCD